MTALSSDLILLLQIGGLAFFTALAVTGFARLGGLGDVPDHRSSHARTTPTAGGLGIIAGLGMAFFYVAMFQVDQVGLRVGQTERLASFLSLVFAIGFLGLLDDRYVLPSRFKFGVILVLSLLAARLIGPVTQLPFGSGQIYLLWWSALIGTTLWLFVVTNAVNFMDGINGMFGLSLMIASGALSALALKAGAPTAALLSGVLAASLLGFLPYNLRGKAAVFSGDCGALAAAFLYAGAVIFLVQEKPNLELLYAGPLLILPFLTDVFLTLVRKPSRGIALLAPHNTHLYQRWARARGGHVGVTLIYGGLALFMAWLVHTAHARETLGSLSGLGMISAVFACLYWLRSAVLPD